MAFTEILLQYYCFITVLFQNCDIFILEMFCVCTSESVRLCMRVCLYVCVGLSIVPATDQPQIDISMKIAYFY